MIVLHERRANTRELSKATLVKTLKEETTLVAKYLGLDDEYIRDSRADNLHDLKTPDRATDAADTDHSHFFSKARQAAAIVQHR